MPISSHFKCQWTKSSDQKFYFSIGTGKAFEKIQQPFMMGKKKKTSHQREYRENILNIAKALYDKPTANIILNGEKLRAFLLNLAKRQIPTLTTSI